MLVIAHVKDGVQVVAIDDAPHRRGDTGTELVFAFCHGDRLEHLARTPVAVDGLDATDTIIQVLEPRLPLFRVIVTHGITVAGLNVIDIDALNRALGRPVIAVTENVPEPGALEAAASHLDQAAARHAFIAGAGPLHAIVTRPGETPVHVHLKGIDVAAATRFLKVQAIRSRLPECLLLAHVIATGLRAPI